MKTLNVALIKRSLPSPIRRTSCCKRYKRPGRLLCSEPESSQRSLLTLFKLTGSQPQKVVLGGFMPSLPWWAEQVVLTEDFAAFIPR